MIVVRHRYPRPQPKLELKIIEALAKRRHTRAELRGKLRADDKSVSEALSRLSRLGLIRSMRALDGDARRQGYELAPWGHIYVASADLLIEHFKKTNILYEGNVRGGDVGSVIRKGDFEVKRVLVTAQELKPTWKLEPTHCDEKVFKQAAELLAKSYREITGLRDHPVEGSVEVTILTKGFAAATNAHLALQGLPKRLRSKVNVKVESNPSKILLKMLLRLDDEDKPAITHASPRELIELLSDVKGRVLLLGLGLTQAGVEVLSFGGGCQIFAMESTERRALADFLRGKGYEVTLMSSHSDAVKAAVESGGLIATHTIVESGTLLRELGRRPLAIFSEPKLIVVNTSFVESLGRAACREICKWLFSGSPSEEEVRRAILKAVTATPETFKELMKSSDRLRSLLSEEDKHASRPPE